MNKIKLVKYMSLVVFVLIQILPTNLHAQKSNLGNWLIYIGSKKINTKWNLHHEIQYRNYDAIGDLEQLLLRTGLGYSFNGNKNNVLLGYGYILSKNYFDTSFKKVSINEHRIFQQFTSKQKVGKINLNHRYRFEQRFVESNFKMRFRYFLGITLPIKMTEDKGLYLSVYNEIFLNAKSQVFDRHRLYGGLGYKIHKNTRFELGYMNQFFEQDHRDQINIIFFNTL